MHLRSLLQFEQLGAIYSCPRPPARPFQVPDSSQATVLEMTKLSCQVEVAFVRHVLWWDSENAMELMQESEDPYEMDPSIRMEARPYEQIQYCGKKHAMRYGWIVTDTSVAVVRAKLSKPTATAESVRNLRLRRTMGIKEASLTSPQRVMRPSQQANGRSSLSRR